jgi:hypothetical protein
MSSRDEMESVIKASVVPVLRKLGFKGSFPHFYREQSGHVDLACFQFSMAGGKFVVELAFATPDRSNVYANAAVPTSKLRVNQTTVRWRLGAPSAHGDNWFIFEQSRAGCFPPNQIASRVAALLQTEGEAWWASKRTAG